MRDAWVLQLKNESKDGTTGDYYFIDGDICDEFVTQNLNDATVFEDKDKAIEEMKKHEAFIKDQYGEDAICNVGYTNMMKHFEFVEVEISEVDEGDIT
ncbi:hypothetical protein [Metabacillus fastidiosus]|uniref:hypothetical protein n=1 Tax=Metabacillus fastidiosus TaxID=1458 RepID=UPI003D299648